MAPMFDVHQHVATLRQRLVTRERTHPGAFLAAATAACAFTLIAVFGSLWFADNVLHNLPSTEQLRRITAMAQTTTIYDRNNWATFTIFQERRVETPLADISPHLVHAIIAVEDQRFYDHRGIDLTRILAAGFTDLRAHRAVQGGSTLTQQLARQSFLTPDKTWRRKMKEMVLAWRLEREFTKDQILELYLNKAYFGGGLFGIEAASLGYFGKHARDLNVAEAALLAGLLKSPSTLAPTISVDRAVRRRNVVLEAMRDSHVIDSTTYERAIVSRPALADAFRSEDTFGQYFKEEVRRQLVRRFGVDRVYQGGLKVYTTIDAEIQKAAETEVRRSLAEIEHRQMKSKAVAPASSGPLQAALVALDPATGEVRAMVGGRDFDESRFNRATQSRRQAGSSFKPFVYATALEEGLTPATVITGLDKPIATPQGAWVPDDHSGSDAMTLRAALSTSSNRAAVQLLQRVGIISAVRHARRLGIDNLPEVPSLALGSGEVTLLSMTSAYAAFANKGVATPPTLIRRVEDASGRLLYMSSPHQESALSEATAFIMSSMMSDVIDGGTGSQARQPGFTLPAAGKTGTTNDFRDAWFVGFTPHLVAGVWIGYDVPRTIIANGYAGALAAPLWGRFMAAATRHDKPDRFHMPASVVSVTLCRLSGELATDGCRSTVVDDGEGDPRNRSMVYTEYFVRGTEPTRYCPLHSGDLAGVATAGSSPSGSAVGTMGNRATPPPAPAGSPR
jgi:penicillin-binding protein 1A